MTPSLFTARLRHARHYAALAAHADDAYEEGGDGIARGLAMFDGERPQIDAAWNWLMIRAGSPDLDELLIDLLYATTCVGALSELANTQPRRRLRSGARRRTRRS